MNYQQQSFNLIRRIACLCALAALLLGSCSNEPELVGSDDNNNRPGAPLIIRSTITGFTRTDSGMQTRIPEENGTGTKFQAGDAIGLFAVTGIGTPSAAIADGINNTCLTYTPSAAGSTPPAGALGSWTGQELTYNSDATYIAYYPYKAGITIDPTKSKEEIIASFANKPDLQPGTDQSTPGQYTASDLMTASGTPSVSGTGEMVLSLNFTHSYSLLVVRPLLVNKLVPPDNAGFEYHPQASPSIVPTGITDMKIQNIKPYKVEEGVFRVIVKSLNGGNITGSYALDAKIIEYSGKPAGWSSFKTGYMYECEIHTPKLGTSGAVVRPLKPGDFVFQHNGKIEIYPGDGELDANGKIPDYTNVVGIVTTCDPARISAYDKSKGWTHAYVMCIELHDTKCLWWPNRTDDISGITPIASGSSEVLKAYMEGLKDTETLITQIQGENVFYWLKNFRLISTVPAGVNRSEWFLPSVGQLYDLLVNVSNIKNDPFTVGGLSAPLFSQLQKANIAAFPSDTWLPSSTLYMNKDVFAVRFLQTLTSIGATHRDEVIFSPAFFFAF